jgi:hypothetical protein
MGEVCLRASEGASLGIGIHWPYAWEKSLINLLRL